MNISTFGARFYGGQIDRIDQGFKDLGHTVNDSVGGLVYCNDMAHFEEAYNYYLIHSNPCKFILNVLDCPTWVSEWPRVQEDWKIKFKDAHKITCISDFVKNDLKQHFDIDAATIYNPIKNVYPIKDIKKDIIFLFVGRASAPNKCVKEILYPLYLALHPFFGPECMHFIGSEYPGFGVSHGVVTDQELNELYNRSLFYLSPNKFEGLNLPVIEAIVTGCLPIICNHLTTKFEVAPPAFLCESSADGMFAKIRQIISNLPKYCQICSEYSTLYKEKFSGRQIAKNILNVYDSLV